jgi:hypothetical protein
LTVAAVYRQLELAGYGILLFSQPLTESPSVELVGWAGALFGDLD